MAIIASSDQQASVQGQGAVMSATVNFSGTLMEMLATVYVYILMAAIREAIQNAGDSAKRAGLTFAEGVLVQLPTPLNPMITITDKGAGMTKEFMETTYMSFGTSTKAGDNGSAGGLGVGRWAAYGYIREAYIATCNAEDMVERTYFQFQGPDNMPQVQLASEVPGKSTGTRVFFPVKATDIDEALRAVAWLKEIMQLTLGDSFTVDAPDLLPAMLPEFSGTMLDLGEEDPSLHGVRVYPMKGSELKYGRSGLQEGSLVVLTNKEAGVGGLPFHVQSPDVHSVFAQGMIIDIPMAFKVPFMPSREELKNTDEVGNLLGRIDAAAASLLVKKVKDLYDEPGLATKATLSNLLGNQEYWHWFARAARNSGQLGERLRKVTGGECWRGVMKIPGILELRAVTVKFVAKDRVLREAFAAAGVMSINAGNTSAAIGFEANDPLMVVYNDLKTGGTQRFRAWLRQQPDDKKFLYITGEQALEAAQALNSEYNNGLVVTPTSRLPDVPRVATGSKVVSSASRASTLTYYHIAKKKQESGVMAFDTPGEAVRMYIGKTGGTLLGFKPDTQMSQLVSSYTAGDLTDVCEHLGLNRVYLLSPTQLKELHKAQAEAQAAGLWDLFPDEFGEDAAGVESCNAVAALKSWIPLDQVLARVVDSPAIQGVLCGDSVRSITESWELSAFCAGIARSPRMALTGTSFDKAIAPHVDPLLGHVKLRTGTSEMRTLHHLCKGLSLIGSHIEVTRDSPESLKGLVATLAHLADAGHLDYKKEWDKLVVKFPLVAAFRRAVDVSEETLQHMCVALAAVYK